MTTEAEVRVTSPTGGQKGSKQARFDLIPTSALDALARHYGKGAEKYARVNGRDNWRNGYDWSLSYAALQRHLQAFWSGEDVDEETGSLHLTAAAWHCFALTLFATEDEYARFDDRQDPKRGQGACVYSNYDPSSTLVGLEDGLYDDGTAIVRGSPV